jgi:hypothetical protein
VFKSKLSVIKTISPSNQLLDIQSFPNPTSDIATLQYVLPENVKDGVVYFYDQKGIKLKEFIVPKETNQIGFSTDNLPAGIYYYELFAGGISSGGRKMIIIK